MTLEQLEQELSLLKARNARVEADKAWETSGTRKGAILVLTYIVIVLFFWIANLGNPFVNAIVPCLGFFLSTLAMPLLKKLWVEKYDVREQ